MTTETPIRVLVVDDSAFARKVLRETLSVSPAIEVVGTARDGLEALEKAAELRPDVMTLDLMMPNLDGLGVLRALPAEGAPRVVVVSISDSNSALAIEALTIGAVDLVQKPTALATDRLYELSGELLAKVVAAGRSHPRIATLATHRASLSRASGRVRLVVVGTSTGGPQALTTFLTALPADLPCAMAVALHIPAGYTTALAARLDAVCAVRVVEAENGADLSPGTVVLAPGGTNLSISAQGAAIRTSIERHPRSLFSPSVDQLFTTAAQSVRSAALGVVLTGMGSDGVEGARALKEAGGMVLTEAEETCVVYGMPRAVKEAGLSDGEAALTAMAEAVLARL